MPTPKDQEGWKEKARQFNGEYGGEYTIGKSKKWNHTATFDTLNDAENFAKSLPPNSGLYIRQYGYYIVTDESGKKGEYVWRTLTQLMTPDYVSQVELSTRRKSLRMFGQTFNTEFAVDWR
jgi:hypothetical protein